MTDNTINLKKPYILDENEAHLAPLEEAARIYCRHLGQDPDHMNAAPGRFEGIPVRKPTWVFAAEKLIDLIYALDSLKQRPANFNAPTH